jgi:hypothetical protein
VAHRIEVGPSALMGKSACSKGRTTVRVTALEEETLIDNWVLPWNPGLATCGTPATQKKNRTDAREQSAKQVPKLQLQGGGCVCLTHNGAQPAAHAEAASQAAVRSEAELEVRAARILPSGRKGLLVRTLVGATCFVASVR